MAVVDGEHDPSVGSGPVTACRAPTVSMYFDQFGNVRACCQNTGTLMGNVATESIHEIWRSANTRRLRAALAVDDYSEGCGFCAWQVDQGDDDIVFARVFDDLPAHEEHPPWPVQMEFSMTNSCNLQCAMCNGDWSSSIRAHREQRPPLPEVYHDTFFEELAEFLPHLRKANFLGGEPFLGREPLRVLAMLSELDQPPAVAITTNGTQWSDRIEAICDRLPISFVLSLDGITKSTYESIRIGADFEQVMANLDRFQASAERHGTTVTLAHCLMRPNWREFSQLLRFAEDRGLDVGMNEVLFPIELSLFQMAPEDLRHVVRTMELDPGGVAASLDQLRHVWDGQLDALRHRLRALDGGVFTIIAPWNDRPVDPGSWGDIARGALSRWSGRGDPIVWITIDESTGRATLDGDLLDPVGRTMEEVALLHRDGRPAALLEELRSALGEDFRIDASEDEYLVNDVVIRSSGTDPVQVRAIWTAQSPGSVIALGFRRPGTVAGAVDVASAWAGGAAPIILWCDEDDVVLRTEGPVATLFRDGPTGLVGRRSPQLLEQLGAELAIEPELSSGPSGHDSDSIVTFRDGEGRTVLEVRAIADRADDGTRLVIGVRRPGPAPSGR